MSPVRKASPRQALSHIQHPESAALRKHPANWRHFPKAPKTTKCPPTFGGPAPINDGILTVCGLATGQSSNCFSVPIPSLSLVLKQGAVALNGHKAEGGTSPFHHTAGHTHLHSHVQLGSLFGGPRGLERAAVHLH